MQVFNLPQQLVVPLFQRPYVWDEQNQWAPLWQDVRRLIEARERDPFGQLTHFLGAIVVQAHDMQLGHIPDNNIIDGQQRLTTLQLGLLHLQPYTVAERTRAVADGTTIL